MDSDSTKRTLIDPSSSERKIGRINTAERQVKSGSVSAAVFAVAGFARARFDRMGPSRIASLI